MDVMFFDTFVLEFSELIYRKIQILNSTGLSAFDWTQIIVNVGFLDSCQRFRRLRIFYWRSLYYVHSNLGDNPDIFLG